MRLPFWGISWCFCASVNQKPFVSKFLYKFDYNIQTNKDFAFIFSLLHAKNHGRWLDSFKSNFKTCSFFSYNEYQIPHDLSPCPIADRENKAESRPIDASSEPPRVTLSHSVTLSYQESRRGVQSHPELLRGTPEESGNGRTDRPTDGHTHV